MYEERLDTLNQQLVGTMRSELELMTQWGMLGEVIRAGVDDTGMDPDFFKGSETFVLCAGDTIGWVFTGDREGLYVCYTADMAPVELYI